MSEPVARLRVELQDLEPTIWRRIDMPLSSTLERLHEAIQVAMGWTFSHLWEFEVAGRRYGDPSFEPFDDEPRLHRAGGLKLGTAIERGADRFLYVYDFGDDWCHDVIVEEIREGAPGEEYPALVDGARRCPPEDVGGWPGFLEFLDAMRDPAHEMHEELVEWHGGPFDPAGFDAERARRGLARMARRRRGGRRKT